MSENRNRSSRLATLVALLFLITSISPFLMATGETPLADQIQEDTTGTPWWENWMYDENHNGMDERIEEKMVTDPETRIPVFVDYSRPPTVEDRELLKAAGFETSYLSHLIDTIFVENILPFEAFQLLDFPDVVMVELNPPIERKLDISTAATKSRESVYYSPDTAWELGYTGTDMVIAVLDTGVDDQHESLNGKFVAGVDVSNQGFDVNGNPDDGNGHGTHCAGIAMGNGGNTDDNGDGEPDYMGTAPDAQLVDVKIGTDVGGNVGGSIVRGIEWCVENMDQYNIKVLSISFGSTSNSDGQDASSRAANDGVDAGLVIVCAAGNDGPNNNGFGSPAAADKAITVGAITDQDTISRADDEIDSYSNRGPRADDGDEDEIDELKPEVCAPGTTIMSTQFSSIGQAGVGYTEKTGTSMSCPHVAGIAALMLEANPQLTPDEVKHLLKQSSEQRGEPFDTEKSSRYSREYGWGIVDAYEAVRLALGGEVPVRIDVSIQAPKEGSALVNKTYINASAEINDGEIENLEIFINGVSIREEKDSSTISYLWDTWKTKNGEYNITVTASGNDAEESSTVMVYVNNTGGGGSPPDEEDENFMDKLINEPMLLFGVFLAFGGLLIGAALLMKPGGRKKEDPELEEEPTVTKTKRAKKSQKKAGVEKKTKARPKTPSRKKKKQHRCGNCENELSFIEDFDAWYCYDCDMYDDEE